MAAAPERGQKAHYLLCLGFFFQKSHKNNKGNSEGSSSAELFFFLPICYNRFFLSRTNYGFICYYWALSILLLCVQRYIYFQQNGQKTPSLQRRSLFRLKLPICNALPSEWTLSASFMGKLLHYCSCEQSLWISLLQVSPQYS